MLPGGGREDDELDEEEDVSAEIKKYNKNKPQRLLPYLLYKNQTPNAKNQGSITETGKEAQQRTKDR